MKAIVLALPLLLATPLVLAADLKAVETKVENKITEMKG
jgi:hypothetical protein